MRLSLLWESKYEHNKSTIPIPYLDYEFRASREGANQWHLISNKLKVDTQLIPILYKLWDAGFMTLGSCRGSPETGKSCGYINFIAKPVPPELMPQLGRPQKTFNEIKQLCQRVAVEPNLSHKVGSHTAFILWNWDDLDSALAAIEKAI